MNRTRLTVAFFLLACAACLAQSSFAGLLNGAAAGAGTTRARAVATVRAILGSNAAACKIDRVRDVTATPSRAGWRVTASVVMSASGRPSNETAVWTVRSTDGEAVPADPLASEIGNGCT